MLDRATGCLENGGRRLLRLTAKSSRTQRSLHSAFWCHGAGDIDLPSWWIFLLQQPLPEKARKAQTITDTARKCLSAGFFEGGFLDFLYPAKTLSLIHKLAVRDARQRNHRSQKLAYQAACRPYSSDAVEPRVPTSSENNHTTGLTSQIRERSVLPTPGTTTNAMVSSPQQDRDLASLQGEYMDQWSRYNAMFSDIPDPPDEDVTEALVMLRRIEAIGSKLNDRLLKRLRDVFADIPRKSRRKSHYTWVIADAMDAKEDNRIIQLYTDAEKLGLHSQALIDSLLRYALVHARSQVGAVALHGLKRLYPSPAKSRRWVQGLFASLKGMPSKLLMARARAVGHHALYRIERTGAKANTGVRSFAAQVLLQALRERGKDVTAQTTFDTFDRLGQLIGHTEMSYSLAIEQLLSAELIDSDDAAIKMYEDMLKVPKLVPGMHLFDSLIARLAAIHDDGHLRRILDDHRKYHIRLSSDAYVYAMGEMSYQGDAAAFDDLFKEHQVCYGNPTNPKLYQNLLHVHARRMEIKEVIEIFQAMETRYHFRPTIDCWNVVLAAFARLSDLEGALKWYNEMIAAGVRPDPNTFSTLSTMYGSGGDVNGVRDLIEKCDSRGLKVSTSLYDSLVLANLRSDDFDEAERIVSDALKMNLVGSRTHMWNYLLNAVAMQRDLDKLQYLFKCMQEADIPADEFTYSALMQGLCVHGMPKSAWLILSRVMPRKQIRPTAFHYAVVFGGFLNSREYEKVVEYYRIMLANGIKPNFSTRTLLLKAVANLDARNASTQTGESTSVNQAEALLAALLEDMDVKELAPTGPQKGIGAQTLNEAYISNYFEYLIYLNAEQGHDDQVFDLFSQYLQTVQRFRPEKGVALPLKMISAIMVSYRRQEQHDEVEKTWYLAVEKAQAIARRSGASLSEPGWVLPGRRFILTVQLMQYMQSLIESNRLDDIDAVLADLTTAGYGIANSILNTYVKSLVLASRPRKALQVAEHELMDGWEGWDSNARASTTPARKGATLPTIDEDPTSTSSDDPTPTAYEDPTPTAYEDSTPTTHPQPIPASPPSPSLTPAVRNLAARTTATPLAFPFQKPRYLLPARAIKRPTFETLTLLSRAYQDVEDEYERNFAMDLRRRLKIKGMGNPMLTLLQREAPRVVAAVLEGRTRGLLMEEGERDWGSAESGRWKK